MTIRYFLIFSIQLAISSCLAIAVQGELAAQDQEFGNQYAKMSDAELWELVKKSKDKTELESLIRQIPLSVFGQACTS